MIQRAPNASKQDAVHLPDFYYRKYALDHDSNPVFQQSRVDESGSIQRKKNTPMVFNAKDDEQRKEENSTFNKFNNCRRSSTVTETDRNLLVSTLQLTTRTGLSLHLLHTSTKKKLN